MAGTYPNLTTNIQDTTYDKPGDTSIANADDYNIHDRELLLHQAVLIAHSTLTPSYTSVTFTQASGVSPLSITSPTLITNLNADMLDGYHASDFAGAASESHAELTYLNWASAGHTIDDNIIPTSSGARGVGTQATAFSEVNAVTGRFDNIYGTNIHGSIINDITVNHASLSNLVWSSAGHTIDTNIDVNSNKLTNVTDPTSDQDAATKAYVDDSVSAENLWDRTATTLTTYNANDDVQVDGDLYLEASGVFQNISTKSITASGNLTVTGEISGDGSNLTGVWLNDSDQISLTGDKTGSFDFTTTGMGNFGSDYTAVIGDPSELASAFMTDGTREVVLAGSAEAADFYDSSTSDEVTLCDGTYALLVLNGDSRFRGDTYLDASGIFQDISVKSIDASGNITATNNYIAGGYYQTSSAISSYLDGADFVGLPGLIWYPFYLEGTATPGLSVDAWMAFDGNTSRIELGITSNDPFWYANVLGDMWASRDITAGDDLIATDDVQFGGVLTASATGITRNHILGRDGADCSIQMGGGTISFDEGDDQFHLNNDVKITGDTTPNASGSRTVGTRAIAFSEGNFGTLRADNSYINNGVFGALQVNTTPTANQDVANKAYVDSSVLAENLWDRSGTLLDTSTSGDSVRINGTLSTGASGIFENITTESITASGNLTVTGDISGDGTGITGVWLNYSDQTSITGSKTGSFDLTTTGTISANLNSTLGSANQYWAVEEIDLTALGYGKYPIWKGYAAEGGVDIGAIERSLIITSVTGANPTILLADLNNTALGTFWYAGDLDVFAVNKGFTINGICKADSFNTATYNLDDTDFGYLNSINQALATTSSPTFADLILTATGVIKPTADNVSAISVTNAAESLKIMEFDTSTPRVYFRVGNSGTDPAWNATDIMVLEAAANTNASLQFFTGNDQIGAFRFSRPTKRNAGGFGYIHSTNTMFFAATIGLDFLTAGVSRLTCDVNGDWLMIGDNKLQYRDTAIGIYSQADTFLDLFADGGIRLTAPLTRVTGDLYVGNDAHVDPAIVMTGDHNDGQVTYKEDEDYFLFSSPVTLPYLGAAPATLVNGMAWMESDGLHIYYNDAEKVVAGV